LAVIVVTLE